MFQLVAMVYYYVTFGLRKRGSNYFLCGNNLNVEHSDGSFIYSRRCRRRQRQRARKLRACSSLCQTGDRMINAASRPNSQPPLQPHPLHSIIQLPMLGPLGPPPANKPLQNNQQQQQQPQPPPQQQGPQPSEIPIPPQSGQDFTLSNVLHFLQTEWRRYERDRNEWEIERAEMRVRVAPLRRLRVCARVLTAGPLAGTHSAARGRPTLLRERQARPHAADQDARVCATR